MKALAAGCDLLAAAAILVQVARPPELHHPGRVPAHQSPGQEGVGRLLHGAGVHSGGGVTPRLQHKHW